MLNKKKRSMREEAHVNYMGGPSYDLSPFMRLYVLATSSFFGESGYYSNVRADEDDDSYIGYLSDVFGSYGEEMKSLMSGKNRGEAIVKAVEDSLAYDAALTLRFLAWLRKDVFMRATPAVGLAVAARNENVRGTGLLTAVSGDVFSRLDDVTNCLAYYLSTYGKPIPNALKKSMAARIEKATEYELAKYSKKKNAVSMKDAINLTHAHSEAVDRFYRGEISQTTQGQETWEGILSKEGSTKEAWTKAVSVMGHMALLRNLRNLVNAGVDESLYLDKLVAGVATGKQLPFRYFSAWKHVSSAAIKDALEKCVDISIKNLPQLGGRSLILVDNSGSARGTQVSSLSSVSVSVCGNLMGVLTGLVSDKADIGVFGDEVEYIPIHKGFKETALAMLAVVNSTGSRVGGSTEHGIWLALDKAIREKIPYDRIFIYSDMQAGHGGLYGTGGYPVWNLGRTERYIDVPFLVNKYRQEVNPNCKLYSIQIGGYADNIFPEFYPNTCILGGWTPEVLRFVSLYEKNFTTVEEVFREKFGLKKK